MGAQIAARCMALVIAMRIFMLFLLFRVDVRALAILNYRGRRGTGPRPTVLDVHFAEIGEGQALALRSIRGVS